MKAKPPRSGARRRRTTGILALAGSVVASFGLAEVVHAAEGGLDNGFGTNGKVTTHIGAVNQWNQGLKDVALAPDGKILVAGYHNYNAGTNDFAVARYLPSGALDPDFGALGVQVAGFGSGQGAEAMAVQTDGKAVLVGAVSGGFGVMRFNTEGGLDRTFSGDGKVTTDVGTGFDSARAVTVQSDGKILVAGDSQVGSRYDFAVVRYLSNGSLDTTFGTAGKVTTRIGSSTTPTATPFALVVQPDGKIVVAGSAVNSTTRADFALVRYTASGELDQTFGTNGKVTTDFSNSDEGLSVALQSDGRILVAGFANNQKVFAMARYETNGSLDTTFGSLGKVTANPTAGEDVATAVAVQPDGRIILAGTADYSQGTGSTDDFAVARYTADGRIDTTFSQGLVTTSIGGGADVAWGMAIQSDGDIVVAGSSFNGKDQDFALVRYSGDEVPPTVSIARAGTGTLGGGAIDALTFTLSEPSSTFDQSDVTVTNGTLSAFTGSGATYTARLASLSSTSATITIDIASGRFTDFGGNPNLAANQLSISFDPTLPSTAGAGTVPPTNDSTGSDDANANGTGSGAGEEPRTTGSPTGTSRTTPNLRVRKTVTLRTIASSIGLGIPNKSKITGAIAKTSKRNCVATSSRVKGLKVGRCRLRITVALQNGSKSQKSVILRVTK